MESSRERLIKALRHQQPEKIPLDMGSTPVSGIAAGALYELRKALKLQDKLVKVHEPFQILGMVEEDIMNALKIDIIGLWGRTNFFGLTWDILKLIGNNKLLTWVYDKPDAIHKLMSFLRDIKIEQFKWMENERLLELNTDNQFAGAGRYGYVSDLPQPDYNGLVRTKDLWGWAESQETGPPIISPAMFSEFFLPYISDLSKMFGLIYYGCCEGLHDRWEAIIKKIPNIRSVSVSGWSDFKKMGGMLGKNYVYSRKPIPTYISGKTPNWNLLKKDLEMTIEAASECNLEFIFRDIYTIDGDGQRLKEWVDMARSALNS